MASRPAALLPVSALPALGLSALLPDAPVVAVPVVPVDGSPVVRGEVPDGVDAAGLLASEKATGDAGEVAAAPALGQKVLLFGAGDGTPAAWRAVGAALARKAKCSPSLAVDLRQLAPDVAGLRALVEGLALASYGFTLKPAAEPRVLQEVHLVVPDPAALQPALEAALAVVRAVAVARDLVNTPALDKTPAWLADRAAELLTGLTVRVRDEQELAAEGWGGVIGVGQGSSRPPRVVEASYTGRKGAPHVVLVGKGITFDTGGISIKPNDGMILMKNDMGGAAAVLATLRAVADLHLPVNVTVLAAIAENMPSGSATRPSDVLVQYGGRTTEVLNTDAEGRLVLADAIAYADLVLKADLIVDVATLTGAMPLALGKKIAGVFSSDDRLAAQLMAASSTSGERLWRMPVVEDYRVALDSSTADLRNIGDPRLKLSGGSITAALFLREFTGGRPWAHLDIAGPAWSAAEDEELTKGGTGYGVRLLVSWLETLSP